LKKLTEIIFLLFFLSSTVYSFYSSPGHGGLPGEAFSSFTASPRALALGDSYVSVKGEAAGMYYNPALSSFMGHQSISAFYTPLPLDGRYASVFYSYPLILGVSAGAGILSLVSGEADKRNIYGGYEGKFRDSKTAFMMNISRNLGKNTAAGVNLKFFNRHIDDYGDTGFGVDAGLSYKPSDMVSLGMRLQNVLPPAIKLHAKTERHPFNLRGGVSVRVPDYSLLGVADIEILDIGGEPFSRWHLGMEYEVFEALRLRCGINYKHITAGVGLDIEKFSYSYALRYSEAGLFHSAGVSVKFGYLPSAREKEIERREQLLERREEIFREWKEEKRRGFLGELEQTYGKVEDELAEVQEKNRELEELIHAAKDIGRGYYDDAEETLGRLLRKDSENRDANILLGIIQDDLQQQFSFNSMMSAYESGEYQKAAREARRADDGHPQYQEARVIGLLSEARISVHEEKFDNAKKLIRRALEIRPGDSLAQSLLRRVERLRELYEGN